VTEKGHPPIKSSNSHIPPGEKKGSLVVPPTPMPFCLRAQPTSFEKEQRMGSRKIPTTSRFSTRKMKRIKIIKMRQIKGQNSSKPQYNSQPLLGHAQ